LPTITQNFSLVTIVEPTKAQNDPEMHTRRKNFSLAVDIDDVIDLMKLPAGVLYGF